MDVLDTINRDILIKLLIDLKDEAINEHSFALKMMGERDSYERDLAKLERENEELNTRLEMAQEQLADYASGRNLHAELLDAQNDRDIATNKNKELEEELGKAREEICKLRVELEGVD